jgi:hypothetical protein
MLSVGKCLLPSSATESAANKKVTINYFSNEIHGLITYGKIPAKLYTPHVN